MRITRCAQSRVLIHSWARIRPRPRLSRSRRRAPPIPQHAPVIAPPCGHRERGPDYSGKVRAARVQVIAQLRVEGGRVQERKDGVLVVEVEREDGVEEVGGREGVEA